MGTKSDDPQKASTPGHAGSAAAPVGNRRAQAFVIVGGVAILLATLAFYLRASSTTPRAPFLVPRPAPSVEEARTDWMRAMGALGAADPPSLDAAGAAPAGSLLWRPRPWALDAAR